MLKKIKEAQSLTNINPLTVKLIEYCDKEKIQNEELAGKLGFTKTGWMAIVTGTRDIRKLPVKNIRIIAYILNISCLSALILSGILCDEDLIEKT